MLVKLTITKKNGTVLDAESFFETSRILNPIATQSGGMTFSYPDRGNNAEEILTDFIVEESMEDYEELTGAVGILAGRTKQTFFLLDARDGLAIGTHDLTELDGSEKELPSGAIIVKSWYDVRTTFVSAGADAGTISLGVPTDGAAGIKAAVAISNGANPWDAGLKDGLQTGSAANFIKLTADRKVQAAVATQNLTDGVLVLCIDYVLAPEVTAGGL